jgi:UDP-N-acetylglucosamine acyltransferase
MPTRVHATAIVESGAVLGTDVVVGAYAFVGPRVSLGDGTVLHHHATVEGLTTMGAGCEVFPHACVGLKTQDLKFKGGTPGTRVGDRNVFREFCTIHAATNDGEFTVIGSDNNFLAYTHVAHDCIVGSHVIMSNCATLAGHMTVGDHVVMGGFAAAHQFCRIGDHAMVGGMSKVVQDVPPFVIADGNPAVVRSINRIGLERSGLTPDQLEAVKAAYRIFYRDGLNRTQALDALLSHPYSGTAEFQLFIGFVKSSERGLTAGK